MFVCLLAVRHVTTIEQICIFHFIIKVEVNVRPYSIFEHRTGAALSLEAVSTQIILAMYMEVGSPYFLQGP